MLCSFNFYVIFINGWDFHLLVSLGRVIGCDVEQSFLAYMCPSVVMETDYQICTPSLHNYSGIF